MTDHWMAQLSEYLDGDLALPERRALEHHLGTCADCRDTLAGLRAVTERAAALVDPPAPNDLWAGIAQRIGTAGSTSADAPALVPLMPVTSSRPSSRKASSTPQVKAPCAPPPCSARVTFLPISRRSSRHPWKYWRRWICDAASEQRNTARAAT